MAVALTVPIFGHDKMVPSEPPRDREVEVRRLSQYVLPTMASRQGGKEGCLGVGGDKVELERSGLANDSS